MRTLSQAVAAKLRLVAKYGRTGPALRRGLAMLARGEFAGLWRKLFRSLDGPDFEDEGSYDEQAAYDAWQAAHALTDADRDRLRREASALADPPRFSVLLLAAGTEADVRRSVESVLRQTYPWWELCVVRGEGAPVFPFPDDSRIRIVCDRDPVAADLQDALAAASGDYITLLDAGDELAEHALSRLAAAVAQDRNRDMLYADEDRMSADGQRFGPFFKPDWSPDLLLSWMYTGRPSAYRTALVRRLGGFRPEFGPAQEYDLALRATADAARVGHVPDILYHRRAERGPADEEAARAALRSHLVRTGREGVVEPGPAPGLHRVRFAIRGAPTVSIVVASACRAVRIRGERTFYLHKCLQSVARRGLEIIVLHGPGVPTELGRRLEEWGAVQAAYATPFNWARAMNQGAALARGGHLLFLNDDVEVITPDWLERLLEFSQQPDVGAVGAKLLFPGGRLQHSGVAVLSGRPAHLFYAHGGDHAGYFNSLLVPRNVSAVTGACLMTRADVFRSVGGFDEGFPLNYNDVDYCLRVIAGGRRVVCTPHARLYHHELGTRPAGVRPEEADAFRRRWGGAWRRTRFTTRTCPPIISTAVFGRPAHEPLPKGALLMDPYFISPPGAVCLVIGGEAIPGGPIRISEQRAALALAARGRRVHVLWCGHVGDAASFRGTRRALEEAGVGVARLDEIPLPAACRAPNGTPGCGPALYTSNLIRHAVESLHRVHRFDAVVFPAWQAAGFRCVQAKQAGTAFTDVSLIVRLDCVGQWLREADKRWPEPDDLFLDYCERYTFENADIRWALSRTMKEEAVRLGWDGAPDGGDETAAAANRGPAEVAFVGDPESPGSLDLFLGAVELLDPHTPIAILIPAGSRRVLRRMGARLKGRPYVVRSGLNHRQAVEFLAAGNRLAVVCDPSETLPPLVRDCIVNGLPFLAARPRWFPGLVCDAADPGPSFIDAKAGNLARRWGDAIRSWCDDAADAVRMDDLESILRPPACPAARPDLAARSPIATVAVTYYNLGRYLPETLASLVAQTCPDLEVLVIDDGSTCEQSRQVWDEQRRRWPQFRFLRQANVGLGAARNRALHETRAPYFIPVDADNIATPRMVEVFVRAMQSDPSASALTCFFLAFKDLDDIEKGQFLYQYCPTGGPHLAACAYNVYGDANAVFRTDDLRGAGGFPTDRSTYCHDWETFVKLARSGRKIGVVPEHLFYYRRRPDAMSAVMTRCGTDVYPFVQRMLTTFFDVDAAPADRALWTMLAGSLLKQARREPPTGPWTLRRLCRGAARRTAAASRILTRLALRTAGLLRPTAPERIGHLAGDALPHRLVQQAGVVAAGDDLDDGVAAQFLERRL